MNFDLSQGYWFPLIVGGVLFTFLLLMPKHISWKEVYITFGVVGYLAWMADMIFAITLDVFDLGKGEIVGIGDIFTFGIIASSLAVIFLNYLKRDNKWILVIVFIILSSLFEWTLVKVGYMKLHGWQTWWSIPAYFIMFGLFLPWHLKFIRKNNP